MSSMENSFQNNSAEEQPKLTTESLKLDIKHNTEELISGLNDQTLYQFDKLGELETHLEELIVRIDLLPQTDADVLNDPAITESLDNTYAEIDSMINSADAVIEKLEKIKLKISELSVRTENQNILN